jgi:hypothetical protein
MRTAISSQLRPRARIHRNVLQTTESVEELHTGTSAPTFKTVFPSAFFLGGRRGTRTPKHFVNLTGESKNFKMLEFPLNQLQTYYGYLCDLCPLTAYIVSDLNYKMVFFLS